VDSWHAAYRGLLPEQRLAKVTLPARTAAWQRILSPPSSASARRGSVTTVFDGEAGLTGFASFGESRDLAGWGEIAALYVAPAHWGRGVGSALFADAIADLTARQLSQVMLWVLEGNSRALQFYRGNGFSLDGARKVEDGYPQLRLRRER
jgi:GNAT superfamily N-acetyltransferase